MAIQNPSHVKGIRDVVHAGIQQFAKEQGIESISADDAACAIAWVLRDMIKQAPTAQKRAELAAGARYAMEDAGRSSIILPGLMN